MAFCSAFSVSVSGSFCPSDDADVTTGATSDISSRGGSFSGSHWLSVKNNRSNNKSGKLFRGTSYLENHQSLHHRHHISVGKSFFGGKKSILFSVNLRRDSGQRDKFECVNSDSLTTVNLMKSSSWRRVQITNQLPTLEADVDDVISDLSHSREEGREGGQGGGGGGSGRKMSGEECFLLRSSTWSNNNNTNKSRGGGEGEEVNYLVYSKPLPAVKLEGSFFISHGSEEGRVKDGQDGGGGGKEISGEGVGEDCLVFPKPHLPLSNGREKDGQAGVGVEGRRFKAALQSSPPPRQKKQESEEGDDYYVNVGYAIRTLREELPGMFYKDLTYGIYRDDITFRDPLNIFTGIDNYKLIFWALRFHGRIFFKALWVDVVRIWQPSDKVIMVRWSVRGLPRVPWEAQGHFDGTSEYKLDKRGKIYEHKVDNVVMNNNQQRLQPLTLLELVRFVGGRTTPTPTYFEKVVMSCVNISPYISIFTWVRFYWALKGTLVLTETLAIASL